MKKLNVAVFGASGRMGQEILSLIQSSKTLSPSLGISRSGAAEGFLRSTDKLNVKDFQEIDVVIDFATAESFSSILSFCASQGIALVSGTTGISESDKKKIAQVSKKIPVL